MSLMILECMHVFCWQAHLVKKGTFLGIIILIFFACALSHHNRVMTGYYVTLKYQAKTQNCFLKSVCNFEVTRFSLILLCKQHNWTLGTYSVETIIYRYIEFFFMCSQCR